MKIKYFLNENDKVVDFDYESIKKELERIADGIKEVDVTKVLDDSITSFHTGITYKDIYLCFINTARSKIEESSAYSYFASRLVLNNLYVGTLKEHFGSVNLTDVYKKGFRAYLNYAVDVGLLDKRLLNYDIDKIESAIKPDRDQLFQYRGIQSIKERYLLRDNKNSKNILEMPQYFWMRVAMGLCLNDENLNDTVIKLYNTMSSMDYIPSTPTLFNSGTIFSQLSSCFLNLSQDSIESIFKTYSDCALLSKFSGGIGTDWTNVRSLGSLVKGTNGRSQGVIPFLKVYNDTALAVNQGGRRKGAFCAYLEVWHSDIEEFLESKKNTGDERRRLHDIHTAVWIPDLFMKRVEEDKDWTLFSPDDVVGLHDLYGESFEKKYEYFEGLNLKSIKVVKAKSLWRKLLTMLFETGHPWITFKDPCNIRNPQDHAGIIHSSNLCTEITLNTSDDETAVCNLGSINLSNMVEGNDVDYVKLKNTVFRAIRALDSVIDINYYPTKESKNSNSKNRPIGLGVMGYQDMLFKLDIPFESEKHLEFTDSLMEKISYYAIECSCELAKELGRYESYKGSQWDRGLMPIDSYKKLNELRGGLELYNDKQDLDWDYLRSKIKKYGMRNSNCLAIAPTATISNVAGVSPCIEPMFRNLYVKENTDGSFVVINEHLVEDLKKLGLWDADMLNNIKIHDGSIDKIESIPEDIKIKHKGVFDIDPKWKLKAAAMRAKWIDQSQSLNIFIDTNSGKVLNDIYFLAWKLGLKTTYYIRTQSVSQIEKTITSKKPVKNIEDCEACQ